MIRILPVEPENVGAITQIMRHTIEKLLKRGSHGFHPVGVYDRTMKGEVVMWAIADDDKPMGVAYTHVERWVEGNVLRILAVAGDNMSEWLEEFVDAMKEHGKNHQCFQMVTEGRKGWGPVLGLKPVRQVYEMELSYE